MSNEPTKLLEPIISFRFDTKQPVKDCYISQLKNCRNYYEMCTWRKIDQCLPCPVAYFESPGCPIRHDQRLDQSLSGRDRVGTAGTEYIRMNLRVRHRRVGRLPTPDPDSNRRHWTEPGGRSIPANPSFPAVCIMIRSASG